MIQYFFHKTFTALLLTFAYTLLLAHNVVPHHHHDEPDQPLTQHQEHHGHGHAAEHPDHDQNKPAKPVADPDHLLSNHQHPFADNKTIHTDDHSRIILLKQVYPAIICFLAFEFNLFHLPDRKPPSPVYLFSSSNFFSLSHSLRGPPMA